MSVDGDSSGDFLDWISKNRLSAADAPTTAHGFVPRWVYGRYLRHCYIRTQHRAAQAGVVVRVVHQPVTSAHTTPDGVTLRTVGGQHFEHDRAALCLGTGKPANVYGLPAGQTYVEDPYPLKDLVAAVPSGAPTLVLGTGLTAVDVALALLRRPRQAPITLASRNGLLPGVRNPRVFTTPVRSTTQRFAELAGSGRMQSLADVWGFVAEELRSRGLHGPHIAEEFSSAENALDRMARHLREVDAGYMWREVASATLHPVIEKVWGEITNAEKDIFLRRYRSAYTAFMNPIPPETARKLLDAQEKGLIRVASGVESVSLEADGKYSMETPAGVTRFSAVVNSINASPHDFSDLASPLIDQLLNDGLVERHEFGGIRIERSSGRVFTDAAGSDPRLFALGQLTVGTHLVTNSVRAIHRQAEVVSAAILEPAHSTPPIPAAAMARGPEAALSTHTR